MEEFDGFREFMSARAGALSRLAFLLTGNHHAAEDLLQSALVKTVARWRKVDDPGAYVRRTMINEAITHGRRRRVIREDPSDAPPERPAGADLADEAARRVAVTRALRLLTPRQRAVLALRFYADLTEAETAREMHTSVGTVKSQTHHALSRLRELAPDLAASLPHEQEVRL